MNPGRTSQVSVAKYRVWSHAAAPRSQACLLPLPNHPLHLKPAEWLDIWAPMLMEWICSPSVAIYSQTMWYVPAPGNTYFGLHSSFWAMVFPRPGGSSLWAQQQGAAGSSRQQAAAGSSRQQQVSAGISRQQQTQADAAVSATAAVQQLAASQQPETYSKLL